jgi:adenylyltransferase/sulfurtransferase
MLPIMTPAQRDRYSRHITLPAIGEAGQQRLLDSHVLIVGLGGLGSPVAMYLAGAGVGKLTLADFDTVEISNLQRQIAHSTERVGELKTHSARAACHAINPDIEIDVIDFAMEANELEGIIPHCSAVVECSDNFPTRFAVNASCVQHKIPLITGAAIRFDGQITVIRPDRPDSPCYRCLYTEGSDTAESCALTGVLGPVVGMIGCVQAIETIKVLCNVGEDLCGRLVLFDGLGMEWHEIQLRRSADCPVCNG